MRVVSSFALAALLAWACACGGGLGGGSDWVKEPLVPEEERASMPSSYGGGSGKAGQPPARTIGGQPNGRAETPPEVDERDAHRGKIVGKFRNTYYDFPNEADHTGPTVALMNGSCQAITQVPRSFYDAVCVQGSGTLTRGATVSFAKRDCACAEVCPRTGQRICFDTLDPATYPWGRGAAGRPITPLRTVAADTTVLPMGTVLYIPDLDGVARLARGTATNDDAIDGCFVVEDRGLRVQGEHVDIFTGAPAQTAALNAQVPSNQGVTVIVDAPKCAYLAKR